GAGKSLCYQLPAAILPGTFLVISPLIALMKDQVDALRARGKVRAAYINSSLSLQQQMDVEREMQRGVYDLVYVAPERLRSSRFREALQGCPLARVVVDEAHCISEWGHDFRPDYLHIGDVFSGDDRAPFLALTATATPRVRADVLARLGIAEARLVALSVDRPNLRWQVRHTPTEEAKLATVAELLRGMTQGSAIVYCGTRQDTQDVAAFVRSRGLACQHYHAGLTSRQRTDVQERFMSDELPVVAATNAFGMGIDKEDIRFVIHHRIPGTLEAYYQEAGRAGRDGQPSDCVLLYAAEDRRLQEYFIEDSLVTRGQLRRLWQAMQALASANRDEPNWLLLDADAEALGTPLNLSDRQVECAIDLLEMGGAARRLADERGMVRVLLRRGPLDGDAKGTVTSMAGRRRDVRTKQLRAMIRYGENPMCRRQQLVAYFGDARPAKREPCCDVCDAKEAAPSTISEMEWRILATVAGLRFPIGRIRLAEVVWGSRSKELLKWGLDEHPQYGALHGTPKKTIIAAIDQLVARGLLVVRGSDKPVLHLTEAGRRALADAPEPVKKPERPPEPPKAPPTPRPHGGPDIPSEDVERLILACVNSIRHGVGRHLLAATLCGGRGKKIKRWDLDKLPEYGSLSQLRQADAIKKIDEAIDRGLLELRGSKWPLVGLTAEGL
ncbi:MAG: RecQ family ATP-dependent DNA helicase, partial [Armatimonadota bacterium]